MKSCSSTGPVVGTVLSHSVNIFVASLYFAFSGISSFTALLSHAVPVNTSITLYLFVPSIVFPSPASNFTLVYPFGTAALGSVPAFTISFALYVAVNVFASTVPAVGTVSLHLSNSCFVSWFIAFSGISSFTALLSHAVPVNTSITLYLFVPSIVFPSPASNFTLVYPFGTAALGSVPAFTSSFALYVAVNILLFSTWSVGLTSGVHLLNSFVVSVGTATSFLIISFKAVSP